MGTAPVAGADVSDADAVSSLVGELDPSAFSAASVADTAASLADTAVGVADPAENVPHRSCDQPLIIDAFFPNQFTDTGAPAGVLGLAGYYLDEYLIGPDGIFPFVDRFLDPFVLEFVKLFTSSAPDVATVGVAVNPVSGLIGAFDPSAFNPLDPVIDGLVGSSTLF